MARSLALLSAPLLAAQLSASCSPHSTSSNSSSSGTGGGGGGSGGPDPTLICATYGLPSRPFREGPYGTHRGEVADDFTIDLTDGTSFHLRERFSGCESYVFIPDRLPVSELDPTSIWEIDKDLAALLKASPRNVHYFFVSRQKTDDLALPAITGMAARIDAALAALAPEDAEHWRAHLHVAAKKSADLGGWLTGVLAGHGRIGFSVDRRQRVRGAGYLADVKKFDSALDAAMKWPWKWNLAYVANEVIYLNAESDLEDRLEKEDATVVPLWSGEVLMEMADTMVTLPSAAEMAKFDTLEVEVVQQCPDPEEIEIGNCGAWDYIANLSLVDDPASPVEIARFITSYHRETHWVVDVSQMLPLLASGGPRPMRWSFAPSWNPQPTKTKLSLRLSNQKKAARAREATFLFSGGTFDAMYNTGKMPVDVPIPTTAKKVELFVIVTGHGAEAGQCSEFCNHQHELKIGDKVYTHDFPMAGTQDKCVPNAAHGMTPNQAGTWWFGRGGWCPGQQVDPWVVDVTADVTPGQPVTVSYRGLYKGADPTAASGNIDLTSYLVVSE